MKKAIAILLAMVMVLALAACGSSGSTAAPASTSAPAAAEEPAASTADSAEVTVAKLAHAGATDSCYQVFAEKFAELVLEKTNGTLQIEIYPNNQLGSDNEAMESLQMNAIQFDVAGFDGMAQYIPDVDIFNLAFLYGSREEALKVLDSDVFQSVTDQYLDYNVRFLGCTDAGFRHLETTDKEINTLADLKGLKIRVPQGDSFMNAFTALGAAPTPTAYSEVFMSLQTGVIDGIELPLDVFASNGFGEVCKYFAYTYYIFNAPAVYVSESFYQSLTEEQQKAVDEASAEAIAYERAWIVEKEASTQAEVEEAWGVTFTNPDLTDFQAACQGLYEQVQNPELLQQIYEVLGR